MPRELDLRAWGGFLGWRPQHVSTLAHQLYKQLHAKDRGEPALYLAPHPTPGTTERTFRSCGEQMGDDSICVGFLIGLKARARDGDTRAHTWALRGLRQRIPTSGKIKGTPSLPSC